MSNDQHRSGHSVAQRLAALVVAVIVINVLPRLLPLPDVDLPSLSFPGLPAWIGTVLHVKNWIMGGLVIAVIVGVGLAEIRRRDDSDRAQPEDPGGDRSSQADQARGSDMSRI